MKKILKKKILFPFLLILLFFLIFPKSCKAFIGTGIFDYFNTALEGVEESSAPIARRFILLFFAVLFGMIFLAISSATLQAIVSNPEWLTLKTPIIDSGLYFTTGLANVFLIFIFVIIAIAFILKIETFQAKKALPKLIVVALLINFLRVFLGIAIDVANIVQTSILRAAGVEDIVTSSLTTIFGSIQDMWVNIGSWLLGMTVLFMIPFIGPFAQYGLVAMIAASAVFLPSLLHWILQTALAVLLGGIFLFLAFIFACRIFAIWFLVILAPLAFLCSILPQTQKYWKEWVRHFTSWLVFGLIVFLFLVIGLRGSDYLAPSGLPPAIPGYAWFSLPSYFNYYFFLFVFLALTAWIAKKTAPEMANAMIATGAAFLGMVTAAGAIVGKGLAKRFREAAARPEAKEEYEKYKKEKEKMEKAGKKIPLRMRMRGAGLRLGVGAARGVGWIHRQVTGKTLEEAEAERLSKLKSEAMKIQTPEELETRIKHAKRWDPNALGIYAAAGIQKGKEFAKKTRELLSEDEIIKASPILRRYNKKKELEALARGYIDKLSEENLREMGFELKDEDREKGYETIKDKIIGEAKGDEIKHFAKNFWKDPSTMEAIQKFWHGPQLSKAAQEFGRKFVDTYSEIVERMKPEEFIRLNPSAALYLAGGAAQDFGYRTPGGWSRRRIRETLERMRREERELEERTRIGMRRLFRKGRLEEEEGK